MRNASANFIAAMASNTAFKEHAEITLSDNTVLELGPGDFTVSGNYVVDGPGLSSFPLGVAVQRQAQLQIMNADGGFSDVDFLNAGVRLYLTLGNEELGLGYFTATTPATYGDTITVTVYDDMYKADKEYAAGITFPATAAALFADVCSCCGITAGGTFKNSTFTVNATPPSGMTCREVLGGIGLIAAGNVHIDDSGVAQVISYTTTPTPPELSLWQTISVEIADTVITGLSAEGATGSVQVGSGDYILPVSCAAFPTQEQDILTLIGVDLLGLTFRVFTGEHIADPLVEFMDYVSVKDLKGVSHRTFITDAQFQFCNFTSLKNSAATSVDNGRTYGSVQRTVNNIRSQVQRLDDQITSKIWQEDIDEASSEIEQKIDSITLRVVGSDGTVSEIQINDQGQINLLGTVLAQKIMAEDIVATGSFQVDNGVWKLVQDTSGFSLETTARSEEYAWAPMAALTLNENGGGLAFDGALAGMQYYKTDSRNNRLTIMLDNSHGIFMYTNNGDTEVAITAGTVTVRNLVSENTIIPETDGYAGLGSPSKCWANVYTNAITLNGTDLATTLSGKAPTSHAVDANTYGLGTTARYGHVKTVNNVTTAAHASGLALSAYQGTVLKGLIDDQAARFEYKEAVSLNTIKTAGLYYCYQCTGTPSGQPWSSFSLEVFAVNDVVRQILRPNVADGFCWERRYDGSSWDSWAETGRTIPVTGNLSTAKSVRKPGSANYGSVIISGTAGGVGAVLIGVTINNGAVVARQNLMTGAAWTSSAFTINYGVVDGVGYLTFKTTSTSSTNICIIGG